MSSPAMTGAVVLQIVAGQPAHIGNTADFTRWRGHKPDQKVFFAVWFHLLILIRSDSRQLNWPFVPVSLFSRRRELDYLRRTEVVFFGCPGALGVNVQIELSPIPGSSRPCHLHEACTNNGTQSATWDKLTYAQLL